MGLSMHAVTVGTVICRRHLPICTTIGIILPAGDGAFFAVAGVDSGPIHLLKDGVNGGNGSLQGVGTETARMQRLPDEIAALGNGGAVPETAILLLQGDKIAFGRGPGRPSGILEEEKRQ